MKPTRVQTEAIQKFSCLGADCPDTCCQGWAMQVTPESLAQYRAEAPELLDAVVVTGAQGVMKRAADTGACVKLEAGWCSIQRDYGPEFLSDACYFYPRVTRALGETLVTGGALSCPQTARLMLCEPDAFHLGLRKEIRTPYFLRNYLPEGFTGEEALDLHQAFLALAGDEQFSAAHNVMRVSAVARGLEMQPTSSWREAFALYVPMAEARIPPAEASAVDLFHLVQAMHGLMVASEAARPRLERLIAALAEMLGVRFTAEGGIELATDAASRVVKVLAHLRAQAPQVQVVLRRYVQAQLSEALFPFAGLGENLSERMTIIGVRFAMTRLAYALLPEHPTEAAIVEVTQTIARFTDHLADAALSLKIFRETGWVREARLRALVGD